MARDTADKRKTDDRRKRPTPVISRYTLSGGRRKTIRRDSDKGRHLFVDLYSGRLAAVVFSLLLLSCVDAYLTLALIDRGVAQELNPVMASVLSYGIMPFTAIKFAITAAALLVLCVLKNARLTRISLPLAIKVYVGVVLYEFYLFMI